MSVVARLTVITGPHQGRRFCLHADCSCVVGRGGDCEVRLAGAERDRLISRRHCELICRPPIVHVRDLGSSNGTYVNADRVGAAAACEDVAESLRADDESFDDTLRLALGTARDGDLLIVGGTSLQVHFLECPLAECPHHDDYEAPSGDRPQWRGESVLTNCPIQCQG